MKETATVLKIEKNGMEVLLQFHEQEGCKNCDSPFCKANERTFTAINKERLSLKAGDVVTVFLPGGKTVGASFLLLIVPLILFILFFLFAGRVLGIRHELGKIGIGLAGFAAGFGISYLLNRTNRSANMPGIIGKIEDRD